MLELSDVRCSYGTSLVLSGVNLRIEAGEVVTLLGRNGMGKSTAVKAVMGIIPVRSGDIHLEGVRISGLPSYEISRLGIGYVPEGRHIFPNLTVRENIIVNARNTHHSRNPWTYEKIMSLFPSLRSRARNGGRQLSGGEQQMVAIGRALMTNPKLLILDEATEGLAPLVRNEIWQCLETLKTAGLAILIIDKNIDHLVRIAQRHYVLEKGEVVWTGESKTLMSDMPKLQKYFGV